MPSAGAMVLLQLQSSDKRPVLSVPFLVNDVFEQHVLHMSIAETTEQTGHSTTLRNPLALSVCSEKTQN